MHQTFIKYYTCDNFNIYVSCCVQKENTFSSLQVENKPREREMEHAFILCTIDCICANSSLQSSEGK
jgi:hypothetical protein